MDEQLLTIEVVYGLPERQKIVVVHVKAGATVEDAINQSGIKQYFDDINLSEHAVGIWNK